MPTDVTNRKPKERAPQGSRLVLFGMMWGIVWPAFLVLILYAASGHWRLAWLRALYGSEAGPLTC